MNKLISLIVVPVLLIIFVIIYFVSRMILFPLQGSFKKDARIKNGIYQTSEIGNETCILFSHGNGEFLDPDSMNVLSKRFGLPVVGYEYSGYGVLCEERTTEENIYENIKKCYNYMIRKQVNDIILMGFSLGCAPTIELASKYKNKIKKVILVSPFTRPVDVLGLSFLKSFIDIFDNIEKIDKIEAPITFFHGKNDRVINISHSVALHGKLKKSKNNRLIKIKNCGHNDIFNNDDFTEEIIDEIFSNNKND